jgi:protein involved in polysaccharide export with SLBB domain
MMIVRADASQDCIMQVLRLSSSVLFRSIAIAATLAVLAGCGTGAQQAGLAAPTASVAPNAAEAPTGEYVLGTSDKLKIIVFNEEELTGDFEVDSSGAVDFPLTGPVKAAGLTPAQFSQALTAALKGGYLRDPKVSVQVQSYRPFFIMGEVTKPGEYPYRNGMNVVSAVATAGGYTYRAQTGSVFLKRANEAQERKVPADPRTTILPGDIVRVPERFF